MTLLNARTPGSSTSIEKLLGKSSSPSWILDTGASHHLTSNSGALTNVRDMEPILIILADVEKGFPRNKARLLLE